MSNYLCIDYGRAHLGLAYADHSLATPLPALHNDPSLFARLGSLLQEYQITHLVVGMPSGPIASEVTSFANRLNLEFSLPVILHDETLSTHEAQVKLRESGAKRAKRRHEHSYAAVLILEDYLENAKLNTNV